MHDAEIYDKLPNEQKEKWLYDLQTAVNDISVMAMQGSTESFGLDPPERCLYYVLADLYRKHSVGELSTDECKLLKQAATKQYEKDRSLLVSYQKQVINHAKMWQRIETLHRFMLTPATGRQKQTHLLKRFTVVSSSLLVAIRH